MFACGETRTYMSFEKPVVHPTCKETGLYEKTDINQQILFPIVKLHA